MGGDIDQALADMAPPMHRAFHKALTAELRKAKFPPVGGKTGATDVWRKIFEDSSKRDQAIAILRRTTRDFDIERGTSITPNLDRELGIAKPANPPPAN